MRIYNWQYIITLTIWQKEKSVKNLYLKKDYFNKKLFPWINKEKWNDEQKPRKSLYNSKLFWTPSYFSFYNSWMYFIFSFYFFDWYSYRNNKFCNTIKNFAITAGIKKYTSIIKKKKKKKKKKSLTQTTQEELHTPIIRKFGKEKVHSTWIKPGVQILLICN